MSFPDTIYEERETENLPGLVYSATDKKNLYSEDFQRHASEIIAIENALGVEPAGAYENVKAWLTALAGAISGLVVSFLDLSDTPASYEGEAGKVLAVNDAEDGIEFVAPSGGGGEWTYLSKITYADESGTKSVTSLASHDYYRIVISVWNITSTEQMSLFLKLNDIGGTAYRLMGTLSNSVFQNYNLAQLPLYEYQYATNDSFSADYRIQGKSVQPTNKRKNVASMGSCGDINAKITLYGYCDGDVNDLNKISLVSTKKITGTIEIWYKDNK